MADYKQRAKELLAKMTLNEKVGQLAQDFWGFNAYTRDENGEIVPLLDKHGHLIVKHDLFNHDGLTQDGIAEAFAEFAKKERLSFF